MRITASAISTAALSAAAACDTAQTTDLPAQAKELVHSVDFPDFVGGLIDGVFDAIVDASIKQTQAYADLVKGVTKSVDDFAKENVSDDQARDYLSENSDDD